MKMEIEKKFLLLALPGGLANGEEIRQGYLSVSDPEVRVRQKGNHYFVTKKAGEGLSREEIEEEVTERVFDILWPATDGRRVEKTRYELTAPDGTVWEVDDYRGKLTGLYTAEVEMASEEADPQRPEKLQGLICAEVTTDKRYKNKMLATHGLPDCS